jgi:hypothetical protein
MLPGEDIKLKNNRRNNFKKKPIFFTSFHSFKVPFPEFVFSPTRLQGDFAIQYAVA